MLLFSVIVSKESSQMSCCRFIKAPERAIIMYSALDSHVALLPLTSDDCSSFTLSSLCPLRMAA